MINTKIIIVKKATSINRFQFVNITHKQKGISILSITEMFKEKNMSVYAIAKETEISTFVIRKVYDWYNESPLHIISSFGGKLSDLITIEP